MRISSLVRNIVGARLNSYTWRTHTCGELRAADVGTKVRLCGWVLNERMGRFVVLKDTYGSVQAIVPANSKSLHLKLGSVLEIIGTVAARPPKQNNPKMSTGEIEVVIDELKLLNEPTVTLPVPLHEFDSLTELEKMRWRYLALRHSDFQWNLKLRAMLVHKIREFLLLHGGFVDIETPTLFRRTPGGAAEFIVPSSMIPEHFYCLPQSPQQFKQLLMVAGIDRYFQIARCYRDEISNPERQPEFTQIDLELSFATAEDILNVVQDFILYAWPEHLQEQKPTAPFYRLKYEDAMKLYGVDKPDLRYDWKIEDISEFKGIFKQKLAESDAINAIVIPQGMTGGISEEYVTSWRKVLQLQHYFSTEFQALGGDQVQREIREKLKAAENDLVIIAWGNLSKVQKTLGFLRVQAAAAMHNSGIKKVYKDGFHFVWITDFPLFTLDEETKKIESTHHPFTAPITEHENQLFSDPLSVTGQHFDLVLNGVELGGGSIRIHNAEIQKRVLEEILVEDSSTMHHLISALASGAPPHGGIALGLDRYVAILCGAKSIRDGL